MATVTHTVVKGDTLASIAKKYGTTTDALIKLNNLKNAKLIYVGQLLYISGKPSYTYANPNKANATVSNQVALISFGLLPNTSPTLFATWKWDKANTDKFEIQWDYYTSNGHWLVGSHSDMQASSSVMHGYIYDSTYTVPDNAVQVRFRVRPISKTYDQKSGDTTKQVKYWTAVWTGYQRYSTVDLKLPTPSTPTVSIDGYKLTCSVDNLNDISVTGSTPYVEFQIIKNGNEQFYIGTSRIIYNAASYSCTIDAGHRYKVRARVKKGDNYGDWSSYSSEINSVPTKPKNTLKLTAKSDTSVHIDWETVASADSYTLQYTTNPDYFNASDAIKEVTNIQNHQYTLTALTSGERYYFRVKAVNDKGSSAWTSVVSIVIGTKPNAPTTWSSANVAIVGEPLIFYWVHNTEDNSKETKAQLWMNINGQTRTINITNESEDDEITTSQYTYNTSSLIEGANISWSVRTAGITGEYGEWSVERSIDVYAKPSLALHLYSNDGTPASIIRTFPFYIKAFAGPSSQTPISYHVVITSADSYDTIDEYGETKRVLSGDILYSKFYDINDDLFIELQPSSVDLQANMNYDITCTVVMDSGLTTEDTRSFTVSWTDEQLVPNAEIVIDKENLVTHIRPYCTEYPYLYYEVTYSGGVYKRTANVIDRIDGISVDNGFTTDGDIVFVGYNSENVMTHYCVIQSSQPIYVPDVTLSVYRRELDGTFTEIGSGLKNQANTFVTDPHPSLDYSKYRIVVRSDNTGSISFTDLPGQFIGEKSIVLQWNERWGEYVLSDNGVIQDLSWVGSILKLPYNVDVSENNNIDVTLVDYIGRSHPVSYYGTKIGSSATWSVAIPKHDTVTLNALRRLSAWLGDVYVREPSGTGYWASINVSFKQTHAELIIPVTIDITRVAGGV